MFSTVYGNSGCEAGAAAVCLKETASEGAVGRTVGDLEFY